MANEMKISNRKWTKRKKTFSKKAGRECKREHADPARTYRVSIRAAVGRFAT